MPLEFNHEHHASECFFVSLLIGSQLVTYNLPAQVATGGDKAAQQGKQAKPKKKKKQAAHKNDLFEIGPFKPRPAVWDWVTDSLEIWQERSEDGRIKEDDLKKLLSGEARGYRACDMFAPREAEALGRRHLKRLRKSVDKADQPEEIKNQIRRYLDDIEARPLATAEDMDRLVDIFLKTGYFVNSRVFQHDIEGVFKAFERLNNPDGEGEVHGYLKHTHPKVLEYIRRNKGNYRYANISDDWRLVLYDDGDCCIFTREDKLMVMFTPRRDRVVGKMERTPAVDPFTMKPYFSLPGGVKKQVGEEDYRYLKLFVEILNENFHAIYGDPFPVIDMQALRHGGTIGKFLNTNIVIAYNMNHPDFRPGKSSIPIISNDEDRKREQEQRKVAQANFELARAQEKCCITLDPIHPEVKEVLDAALPGASPEKRQLAMEMGYICRFSDLLPDKSWSLQDDEAHKGWRLKGSCELGFAGGSRGYGNIAFMGSDCGDRYDCDFNVHILWRCSAGISHPKVSMLVMGWPYTDGTGSLYAAVNGGLGCNTGGWDKMQITTLVNALIHLKLYLKQQGIDVEGDVGGLSPKEKIMLDLYWQFHNRCSLACLWRSYGYGVRTDKFEELEKDIDWYKGNLQKGYPHQQEMVDAYSSIIPRERNLPSQQTMQSDRGGRPTYYFLGKGDFLPRIGYSWDEKAKKVNGLEKLPWDFWDGSVTTNG